MTRRVKEALLQMPEPNRFVRGMVSWIGFRQVPLLYDRPARLAGVTKWPLRQMVGLALDAILGFSLRPLRLIPFLGVGCALCFLALSIVAAGRWFASGDIEPNLVVFLSASLFGAVQLCGLSLIAEYAGRTYLQTLGRPLFLVDQIVSRPNGPSKEDDHATP
jgi:dolichol-phosphate mannosyltransferase